MKKLNLTTLIENTRKFKDLSQKGIQRSLFNPKTLEKILAELLENQKSFQCNPVKLGVLSHLDYYYHFCDSMIYQAQTHFNHITQKKLCKRVGYQFQKPIIDALRNREIERHQIGELKNNNSISLEDFCKDYFEVAFYPIVPHFDYLAHDLSIGNPYQLGIREGEEQVKSFERLIFSLKKGLLGDDSAILSSHPTFLKDPTFINDDGDWGDSGGLFTIRFHVHTKSLLQLRDIYNDPDNLYDLYNQLPDENDPDNAYGRTFMVPGGVPISTIHSFTLWNPSEDDPPMIKGTK